MTICALLTLIRKSQNIYCLILHWAMVQSPAGVSPTFTQERPKAPPSTALLVTCDTAAAECCDGTCLVPRFRCHVSRGGQRGRHAPVPSAGVDTLSGGGAVAREAPGASEWYGECGAHLTTTTSGQCHHRHHSWDRGSHGVTSS